MSLLNLLNPGLAEKQEALQFKRAEGLRNSTAMSEVLESIKPKPDVAGSMYSASDVGGNNVLSALTQSPDARAAHKSLVPKQSPLERMRATALGMIQKDNKYVQGKGHDMLAKYQALVTGDDRTNDQKDYEYGQGQEGSKKMSFLDYENSQRTKMFDDTIKRGFVSSEDKQTAGVDPQAPFTWNSDGGMSPVKTSAYTEANLKAAGFAERMNSSEQELEELMSSGFDPTTIQQKLGETVPYIGSHIQSGEQQLATRIQRDWIRSKLRDESGATINSDEMESEIETYFPQPGNKPLVIAAKKRARERAARAMERKSGGKFKPYTKEERKAMRDIVKKDIEKAKLAEGKNIVDDSSWMPKGFERVVK